MASTNNEYLRLCFSIAIFLSFILTNVFVNSKRIIPKHKYAVKTVLAKNGDMIDCVGIYRQPAFDHPLLQNHTIQMEPPYPTKRKENEVFQIWWENGECPKGTIPILRQERHKFHAKGSLSSRDYDDDRSKHEHAYAAVSDEGGNIYAASARINVWSPATENNEISVAQIWVTAGEDQDNSLNTMEVGWIVNMPDSVPRFFTFWTGDNYESTGCYNLQCPGFVQVNPSIAIGFPLDLISFYNAEQTYMSITIHKDTQKGNWWLLYQGEAIGYWPDIIFSTLKGGANSVSWGGEIYNSGQGGHHTTTDMGSGHFPFEGFGKASIIANLQFGSDINDLKDPQGLTAFAMKPSCYDVQIQQNIDFGTHIYFGGPGYSSTCQI